jgi:protein involved in polysaccharide export with SLBB domain
VGAKIDITMGSLKSIPVFVLGDVVRPGAYTIDSFSTITDALLLAGGPSGIGSMRNVQLKRKGKVVTHFDLYDLFLKGDKSKDLTLRSGDVVFVPVSGPVVGLAGNVKRPAIYELKGQHDLGTLFDLGGGIIPTAYTQQIQIERVVKNDRQIVIDVADKDLTKAKLFLLQDFDLVKVFNIVGKEENVIFLQGNVKRPGKYEYKPGMTLRDILKNEKELLPETYRQYAVLKRMAPPSYRLRSIPLNLQALFGDKKYNIDLKPQDSIVVFSKWFFRDQPFVLVEGEVRGTSSPVLKTTVDPKVLDGLRNRGIIRRDDPRLAEVKAAGGPEIDRKRLDELRRTSGLLTSYAVSA